MASCSLATLQEQACANGFLKVTEKQFNAILLVQLANLGSNTLTLDELQVQACANKFKAVNEKQFRAAWLQLLCNLTDGLRDVSNCINVVPAGSFYDVSGVFDLTGMLQAGTTYLYTGGANETALFNGNNGQVPNGTTFVAEDGAVLTGSDGLIPVTATICEVQP